LFSLVNVKSLNGTPSHSYGMSLDMGSHSVTFHSTQVNTSRLKHSQTGRYLIYLPLEGWKAEFT